MNRSPFPVLLLANFRQIISSGAGWTQAVNETEIHCSTPQVSVLTTSWLYSTCAGIENLKWAMPNLAVTKWNLIRNVPASTNHWAEMLYNRTLKLFNTYWQWYIKSALTWSGKVSKTCYLLLDFPSKLPFLKNYSVVCAIFFMSATTCLECSMQGLSFVWDIFVVHFE